MEVVGGFERVLRHQRIDENQPGTVLRDVHTMLDMVAEGEVIVRAQHYLWPMTLLEPLNARLVQPYAVTLRRPQLRSYPNVQGLYLLLRSSGLGKIVLKGKKSRMVLDEALLDSWRSLNSTERYFTLLEVWLLHGHGEAIGGSSGRQMMFEAMMRWQSMKDDETLRTDPNNRSFILHDAYHLALMDLFGLVQIEQGPARPNSPWTPTRTRRTDWGKAIMAVLHERGKEVLFGDLGRADKLGEHEAEKTVDQGDGEGETRPADGESDEDEKPEDGVHPTPPEEFDDEAVAGEASFGILRPVFEPYFAEWRRNLTVPPAPFREGVFVFRVSVANAWREIAIPAHLTFQDLADAILDAYEFDDDHLYQFRYPDRFGGTMTVVHPYCNEGFPAHEARIGRVPLEVGQSMDFHYDFGDDWHFRVDLERVGSPDARQKRPKLVGKRGEAPEQYEWH